MSRTDHHGNTAARVQTHESRPRWQHGMTDREAIAEALADHLRLDMPVFIRSTRRYVEPYRGLQTDFVAQPYTLGQRLDVTGWNADYREVRLSNCEFGCKVYSDGTTERIEHSRTYGCRKASEPVVKPVIQRVQPKRQRITERVRPGKPNRSANLDVDSPSLMHMAKARAKALGL